MVCTLGLLIWTLAAGAAEPDCSTGMVRGADTEGNCCWPDQAWTGSACVGEPSICPAALLIHPDGCARVACHEGRIWVTPGECCLPAQSWDVGAKTCVGTPQCPVGSLLDPGTNTCQSPAGGGVAGGVVGGVVGFGTLKVAADRYTMVPLGTPSEGDAPSCPAGQHVSGVQHCCWVNQGWSTPAGACIGEPTCPPGAYRFADGCAVDARPDEAARTVYWTEVHVKQKVVPTRPPNAVWPAGESVICVVRFKLDRAGLATSITPLTCPAAFVEPTLEAARGWAFYPHKDAEGKAVAVQFDIAFKYPHP